MAIIKAPARVAVDKVDEFINAAPDGRNPRRIKKGNKVQISLTITEKMLGEIDTLARARGQSRAGLINLAIAQVLESGLHLDSKTNF
jgi:hypothetical protein